MPEIHGMTRPSPGCRGNEDCLLFGTHPVPHAVVCDGAGKADGAARRACQLLQRLLSSASREEAAKPDTWLGWLPILDAHLIGIGESTFIGGALIDRLFVGVCVGDSRAYVQRSGSGVELLTKMPNKIRLGTGRARGFDFWCHLEAGDRLFLMTDGAWTPFETPERMQTLLAPHGGLPLYRLPEAILDDVSCTGHQDDMTVAVLTP